MLRDVCPVLDAKDYSENGSSFLIKSEVIGKL